MKKLENKSEGLNKKLLKKKQENKNRNKILK